jgi:hypothetical protein
LQKTEEASEEEEEVEEEEAEGVEEVGSSRVDRLVDDGRVENEDGGWLSSNSS